MYVCVCALSCVRGAEVFSVRINTAADSEATFTLQYEELMVRRRSKYQQVLNLNPGSLVDDVSVQVRVVDPQGVIETAAPDYVTKNRISRNEVVFTYSPTTQQQKEDSDQFGLGRDLTIEFDVRPSSDDAGSFVVDVNCYFAQFFAPAGVSAVPVDLVFVIDVSGSMSGTKISQTRQALETIINELRSTDRFTMITFSTTVTRWRPRLVSAGEYRETAVEFVRGLEADGSTNFNAAVLDGADVLKTYGSSEYVPLLVVLTDGEPTVGVTNENEIVENVHTALSGTVISLNCLGFGNSLNFQLLERLALQNNGIVRRIYEAVDAPEQLEGFFEEISSPVLRNVVVSYDSASVDSLSTTEFPLLFDGGEIVVAGKCDESSPEINVEITGTGGDGLVSYQTDFSTTPTDTIAGFSPSTERLLAYLLIQQLLETKFTLSDEELIEVNLRQALRLSLKYNFVTELTSLIVVEESDDGSGSSSESIIGGDGQGDDGEYEYDVAFATAVDYDYSNPHFAPSGGSPPAHAVPAIAAIIMLIMTVHALM